MYPGIMLKREVDPVTRVVIERKIAFLSARRSAFLMLKERKSTM